jgi:hypothetical protein
MKKFFLSLVFIFSILLSWNVFAYTSYEWSIVIEDVKKELSWTKYSFKDNEWSSWMSSYHIFYDWKIVWYIYSTNNWISMWSWWQENWEVWTFFTKKDFTKKDVLNYFYKKKVITSKIKSDNFTIKNKKISYKKNTKNVRMYFEVDVSIKKNFILELSLKKEFPNWWSLESKNTYNLLDNKNKIYFWEILNWDIWNSFIDWYSIKIYECTNWLGETVCIWKQEVYKESKYNLNISTSKDYNIDTKKIRVNKIKQNSFHIIKKIEYQYVKQSIISKLNLEKTSKGRKLIKKIDSVVKKIGKEKLEKVYNKIQSLPSNVRKHKKYKYVLNYMEARIWLKLIWDKSLNHDNNYLDNKEIKTSLKKTDWRSVDSNCNIPDIIIWNQIWAWCNSTIWNWIEFVKDIERSCWNYNWWDWKSCSNTENFSNSKEKNWNKFNWVDNIWWKLYSWDNASSACTNWYHLPSEEEWTTLENNTKGVNLRKKLILPLSGFRAVSGNSFHNRWLTTFLWGSNPWDNQSFFTINLHYNKNSFNKRYSNKNNYVSVRCIKD